MSDTLSLDRATAAEGALLANLLELYIHDLSALFTSVELGVDGRFGYSKLPLYFAEPERRAAFIIRLGARPVGFALATRGSPVVPDDPEVLDVAEFFVTRRYRRTGVGGAAAALLFGALPGTWTVRVASQNTRALSFWTQVVAEYTQGTATEFDVPGGTATWHVFRFEGARV